MLETSKLLIDKDCPMCNLYGQCFVNAKLITKDTLSPYQHFDQKNKYVDFHKAKNKIALYNEQTNLTIYGIDTLIHIVSHNRIWLNKLLKSSVIYFLLSLLYNLISYNRKLIFPVKAKSNTICCEPDLKHSYRITYIILTAIFTGFILTQFSKLINPTLGINTNPLFEYLIAFGQIIWQGLFLLIIRNKIHYDYLGNMSTVSLLGSILLGMVLILNIIIPLSFTILLLGFTAIVGIMFLEHIRRVSILQLPFVTTISWVIFRLLIVLILFI